jgi:hypothetical protein
MCGGFLMSFLTPMQGHSTGRCASAVPLLMETTEPILCPFCGQSIELVIDTSAGSHRFTTDCEVCCRPMEVRVECEPGRIHQIDVSCG